MKRTVATSARSCASCVRISQARLSARSWPSATRETSLLVSYHAELGSDSARALALLGSLAATEQAEAATVQVEPRTSSGRQALAVGLDCSGGYLPPVAAAPVSSHARACS